MARRMEPHFNGEETAGFSAPTTWIREPALTSGGKTGETARRTSQKCMYECSGQAHGFDWWLEIDASLSQERHWTEGQRHGIEREWNHKGGLRRGYPRYYVHGEPLTKQHYVKACAKDTTLPPFHLDDNSPQRVFSPEIAIHLRPVGA